MIYIIEKVNNLTQRQKELLGKQLIIFSMARLEACKSLIEGLDSQKVFDLIQTNFIPEYSYAQHIVYNAQRILLPHSEYRLKYIIYLRKKLQFLIGQIHNDSLNQKKENIVYVLFINKELKFYDEYITSLDLKKVDQSPLLYNGTQDSKKIKVYYNSNQKKLIVDLKLSWKEKSVTWLKGLVSDVSMENDVILKNIFGSGKKRNFLKEIPTTSSEVIWDEEQLYIKISPAIEILPSKKNNPNIIRIGKA